MIKYYENELKHVTNALVLWYTGNVHDATNRDRLRELGITHILNMTSHIACHFEQDAELTYKRIQASDSGSQNLKQYFMEAAAFIGV